MEGIVQVDCVHMIGGTIKGMFGTTVTHRAVRYVYRGARAAVPKTQVLVHLCSSDAVCGEKNHRTVGAFGAIIGLFSPPPQETWSQTRPNIHFRRFSFSSVVLLKSSKILKRVSTSSQQGLVKITSRLIWRFSVLHDGLSRGS